MKRNRFTDEQIVAALRDAEVTTVVEAARKHGDAVIMNAGRIARKTILRQRWLILDYVK